MAPTRRLAPLVLLTAAATAVSGALSTRPAAGTFPPPVVPDLPMGRYPVHGPPGGDAVCPPGTNATALAAARLATIARYGALRDAPDFATFNRSMRALWDTDDPAIRVIVPAAGVYTGIEDLTEYVTLVVGALNGGYVYYAGADVRALRWTPSNASVSFALAQTSRWYCARPPTEADGGACETDATPALSAQHVSFKPCTALLRQYAIEYDGTWGWGGAHCVPHPRFRGGAGGGAAGGVGGCHAALVSVGGGVRLVPCRPPPRGARPDRLRSATNTSCRGAPVGRPACVLVCCCCRRQRSIRTSGGSVCRRSPPSRLPPCSDASVSRCSRRAVGGHVRPPRSVVYGRQRAVRVV